MMGIMNLIIVCVIVVAVVKSAKKQNGQGGAGGNNRNVKGTLPDYRGYRQTTGSYQPQRKPVSGQPPKRSVKTGNASAQAGGNSYGKPSGGRKEQSTTDYLNRKAEQDQREHEIEKRQERERVDQKYGNRPVGGRYMPGDPVPSGMQIVCCEYCGAENLVKIGYRGDRNCYFCRTRLEE